MNEIKYYRIIEFLDSNRIPLLVFFTSLFAFISFSGTRLFLSDEGVILDQFYNLINGSLSLEFAKIDTAKGVFILVGDRLYGKFSYSLLFLSLPAYYILRTIDLFYGAHLFILQLWALSGGFIIYLIAKTRNIKYAAAGGVISYLFLIASNLYFFKPIYFPMWGELLSLEFTNILISSFLVLVVYYLFKDFFNEKIAILASFFMLVATPIPFYAITLKHHSLAVLLTLLAFYFFYKYHEKRNNKFIYLAYISAGLCVWTRILDGAVILASLLITDIFVLRRSFKHVFLTFLVIIISLLPFFGFNYLIMGDPFSAVEKAPLADKPVTLFNAKNIILLGENTGNPGQIELLTALGFVWDADIRGGWVDFLGNAFFSRLKNTFGIFLISPFLISSLAFVLYKIRRKLKLNAMDIFFGLYIILLIFLNKNYLFVIISDTPMGLDYRYLLITYIILLYFAFRIDKLREFIEKELKKIALLYGIILITGLIYFIVEFPPQFMNVYYYSATITSLSLIVILSKSLFIPAKRSAGILLNNMALFLIALSLAEASMFLLFYYWTVSMTYISPSQNFTILPILENLLKWMYQIVL